MRINHASTANSQKTTNYHGSVAYKISPKMELVQRVATCYWNEPKFYESGDAGATAIIELIQKVADQDPKFVLQLAKTIRAPPFNMRTVAVVMWVEAGLNEKIRALKDENGRSLVRQYGPSIIKRADELSEALAYLIQQVGKIGSQGSGTIPSALKSGLADAFDNFDEYQFAKYSAKDKDVKLSDVIRLVRPKPRAVTLNGKKYTKAQRSKTYHAVRHNLLRNDTTWESILSEKGRSKETWNQILAMGKEIGIMALVRNLRNIKQVNADIETALKRVTDPQEILKSKMHSYRFYTAYKAIEAEGGLNQDILDALITALEISAGNLPKLGGTSLIAVDNSGSMKQTLSGESVVQACDISNFLGAVGHYICDKSIVVSYGTEPKVVALSKHDTIITNMEKLARADTGGNTFAYKVIDYAIQNNIFVDRFIFSSDEQQYGQQPMLMSWYGHGQERVLEQALAEYRKKINPNAWCYTINVVGYGNVALNPSDKRNVELAGWNAQLFHFIKANESDQESFVKTVEQVTP